MELAKPALDVGLYTNQIDSMLAFWQEQAQVPFSELLKVGGGVHQHRHAIGNSVLKINHRREAVPQAEPCGLASLEIFSSHVDEPMDLLDPDGNEVRLSPADDDINLVLHMHVNNLATSQRFYGEALGFEVDEAQRFCVGASRIAMTQHSVGPVERVATGYRYMTVQVFDVVGTHQALLDWGATEGMAPVRLGEVAYISFVCDPDGNWIEISQRKSITGSLD